MTGLGTECGTISLFDGEEISSLFDFAFFGDFIP